MTIDEIEYYGTGVDSIPIQIGGGNIDKVANFRVYNKFIEEDQALEIWDAQKDAFGRAKSSMTLQKGRLGLGTEEPEGRLAVLDEPHNVEEFPPRALSADKTYIEGHGEFCTSVTEIYPNAYAYKAFNKIQSGSGLDFHWSANTADYDNGTGAYTGTSDYFTNVEGHIALGHWIQIEFPYKINYRYSEIQGPDHAVGRQPHTGYIVGSNDLSGVWTSLHNYSGMTRTGARDFVTYTPPTISTQSFKYFRLVIEKMGGGNTHAGVSQWHIFGTREQGQSVLHDGQLTLTKNLDVPRIGPAPDVDDTPRRDRLAVEYNTSTNPTFEGAVRDTSGRGFDGINMGSNSYNAGLKAFTGFSSANYIRTNISLFRGNVPHTHSVWFKLTSNNGNWNTVINLGQNGSGNGDQSAVTWDTSNNRLWLNTYNGGVYVELTPSIGKWYHVVATHDGSGNPSNSTMKIYIDGVKQTTVDTGNNSGGTIDVTGDYLTIGAGRSSSGVIQNVFNGDISNYKLYDIALTTTEAKTLYDMGRCDEGHHVVNFSKTRVGIGLGDGEAPRGVLDVRGDIYRNGVPAFPIPTAHFYKQSSSTTSTHHYANIQSGWVALTHAPVIVPGVIEGYSLTGASTNTDGGTSGTVVKLCKEGLYKIQLSCSLSTQSAINSHIGIYIRPVSTSYISGNTGTDYIGIGDANGYSVINAAQGSNAQHLFHRFEIIRVTKAPGYAYVSMTPNSNNSGHFRFQNYGATPYAVMNVMYLG